MTQITTQTPSDVAVVRHIKTNTLYRFIGNDTYRILTTGKTGVIPSEQAQRIFKINLEMTQLIGEYPIVEELIQKLKLTYEQTKA